VLLRILHLDWIYEIDKKHYNLFFATGLFFGSIMFGITGFMLIENYNFVDAFYMTVITVATVGFTEVNPLSEKGKIFTSIFIIFNLGFFAIFASILTRYILEGEINKIFSNYRLLKSVKKMENHVIVCGYGRNGHKACEELRNKRVPFVVIERDIQIFNEMYGERKDFPHIEGDATQDEVLKVAGIDRARALITTLPKDSDNVFVTLTARTLNPKIMIVSRVNQSSSENKLIRAGANRLVNPDFIGGTYMANLITKPHVAEFLDMIDGAGELQLDEFCYEDFKEEYREQTIRDLDVRNKTGVTIMGFKDNVKGFIINPNPNMVFGEGDVLILLGTVEQIKTFAKVYTHKN
jgi:voltage-gated potassium channel